MASWLETARRGSTRSKEQFWTRAERSEAEAAGLSGWTAGPPEDPGTPHMGRHP